MSHTTQRHDTPASPIGITAVLRLPTVIRITGLGRSTIYHWMDRGLFPRPIQLGPRAIGWLAGDIDRWLLSRRQGEQKVSGTSALANPRCRGE